MKHHIEKGAIFLVVLVLTAAALTIMAPTEANAIVGKAISPLTAGCISGSYDCSGEYLLYCELGKWKNYKRCPNGCRDNICISGGDCRTGETGCLNEYRQECRNGAWINIERCATGCSNGQCSGGDQCNIGDFQCNNEYLQYCKSGMWFNKERCSSGCSKGACKGYSEKMWCKDTDSGKDFAVKGKVTGYDRQNEYYALYDKCISDEEILEYFCNDRWYMEERHLCDEGACKAGECVVSEEEPEPYIQEPEEEIVVETIAPVIDTIIPEAEEETGKKGFFSTIGSWFKNLFN